MMELTGQHAEAKAVRAKCGALNLGKHLVSASLSSRAGDPTSGEVEVSEAVSIARCLLAELILDATGRNSSGVSNGVAQSTVGCNVDLLASGHNDTQGEGLVAAGQDSGVPGRAGIADLLNRAVRARSAAAEVELCAAGSEAL